MRIKGAKRRRKNPVILVFFGILFALIAITVTSLLDDEKKVDETQVELLADDRNDLDLVPLDYPGLIAGDTQLHASKNVQIYGMENDGRPKLVYVYKGKLDERESSDKFFVHLFLKDSTAFPEPYINLVFTNVKGQTIDANGKDYTAFELTLEHRKYKDRYIPLKAIEKINTGRFWIGKGRSLEVLDMTVPPAKIGRFITKLDLSAIDANGEGYTPQKLIVLTKEKSMDRIRAKRAEALQNGLLVTGDDDLQDGEISGNKDEFQNMEFRLKGDWTDHIEDPVKWSYRIIMKGEKTFNGMRKFSVQHPKTRNYQWEWLFNKVVKDQDIVGLRYEFVQMEVAVKNENGLDRIDYGIMALEESFDKILIENNKKREGVIIGFDESLVWNERHQQLKYGLALEALDHDLETAKFAPIRVFNQNKILSDPNLARQLDIAKDLLDGLRKGIYKPSEVFDLDKLTDYVAISNLFGAGHGLVWHNLRIYYNPVTNKLEPISFDTNSGGRTDYIVHYPFSQGDKAYHDMMRVKLQEVSDIRYINAILQKYGSQLNGLIELINDEFSYVFNPKVLEYNSNYIKKSIYPENLITAALQDIDETQLVLDIQNVSKHPVEVVRLEHLDGKRLDNIEDPLILEARELARTSIDLDASFDNAFVSKKSKKGGFRYPKDVEQLRLVVRIQGVELERKIEIQAFGSNKDLQSSIEAYRKAETSNYQEFPFIQKEVDGSLRFAKGTYRLDKTLTIAQDVQILIEPGFELDMRQEASLIAKGNLVALGTAEEPIRFYSSDGKARGIFFNGSTKPSKLDHCYFENLSNPIVGPWSLSGAVNFNETVVHIDNSRFISNRCEDALNIIRSQFTLTNSLFEQTFSDSFDGDFVTGTVQKCIFRDSGNDGVDVSGSNIELIDLLIENPSDKAISAGEASTMTGNNIKIISGEIGVVSKDLSSINFDGVEVTDTRLGLSAFQKKSEYGVAKISINNLVLNNVEKAHLIELNSELRIDNKLMETVSNKVIEQMYGNEYGKSSK